MKVSEWKKMINKLEDEDELCIARVSQDFGIIRINYDNPILCKSNDIDKSWKLQEVNKFNNKVDYLIY